MTTPTPAPETAPPPVVLDEHGQLVGAPPNPPGDVTADLAAQIEQPAKVMRIGTMVKQLLEEVRAAPLDEASRKRLREIHQASIHELELGLAPELTEELHRLSLPFSDEETPTDAELRIAQAQLVGWLEGVFHGIQAALVSQQMAARMELDQMRRPALPAAGKDGAAESAPSPGHPTGTGQYL